MRLIDADALIEDLEYDVELDARALDDTDLLLGRNRELVQFDKDCKQNAVDMLKKAPTVDAEPVRHGVWKKSEEKEWWWYCSNCQEHYFEDDLKINEKQFPNYCPNCGARMR